MRDLELAGGDSPGVTDGPFEWGVSVRPPRHVPCRLSTPSLLLSADPAFLSYLTFSPVVPSAKVSTAKVPMLSRCYDPPPTKHLVSESLTERFGVGN